jgi:hypothetical protein
MLNHPIPLTFAAIVALGALHMGTAAAQGVQHFAVLNGGNEVSAAGAASAGDPDGSGAASIIVLGNRICYSILVEKIGTPNAAHVHEAEAGANGPIVVPLTPPPAGNPGFQAGCSSPLGAALLTRLRNTPNRFYVNVHNVAFPAGAVRGQLF